MRPDASFMVRHPAHWIALGFGSGLSPRAPGTMGTLWAWLCWWAFQDYFSVGEQAAVIFLSSLVGIWACKVTAHPLLSLLDNNGQSLPYSLESFDHFKTP